MATLDKLKASMRIGSLDIKEKLNIELTFLEDSFSIYFIEPLSEQNIREIKNLFSSFLSSDNRSIKLNYIYIKTIFLDGSNLLKFTIYNPITTSIFTLIFNRFKYKKKFLLIKSIPSSNLMNNIVSEIKKRNQQQIMQSINNFINVIYIFYEFRNAERRYNNVINDIFIKAFNFGIIFYDKSIKEFNLSQQKIKQYPKEKQNKINDDLADIDDFLPNQEINADKNNSTDVEREDNIKNKNNETKIDLNSELGIDSVNQKDLFQYYPLFKKFPMDLKISSSYFTEITINLIYKLLNVNIEEFDNKYGVLNKTINGQIINKNLRTELFTLNNSNILYQNIYRSNNNKANDKINLEDKINKWFEFSKKFHSFIPNNSTDNINSNAAQIIQRKFFEILFKTFFSNIISIEINKNKTLTSDEFHQILRILRRLKSILFNNKNLKYYPDFEFLNEEQNSFFLFNNSII
jgi:hypothetical protein